MISLIRSNSVILNQGIALLEKHSQESYTATDPKVFGSSIGAHVRHVLDHYASVLRGLETGVVDYDDRERNTRVETDLEGGKSEFRRILGLIGGLESEGERALEVKVSSSTEGEESSCRSSLGRELQFLVSHTVHHFALISIASRIQGVYPDETFGVAPSTLKYLQATSV